MRHNVVIKQLSVVVAASDQSYMPQQIAVAVGKNVHSLREIKDVRIPAYATQIILVFFYFDILAVLPTCDRKELQIICTLEKKIWLP